MFSKKPQKSLRDPRLTATDQQRFSKTATEVIEMFDDKGMTENPLLSKSPGMGHGHTLAGPTGVSSGKVDPLKAEAEKAQNATYSFRPGKRERPKTYREQLNRLSEVYDKYMNVDINKELQERRLKRAREISRQGDADKTAGQ